MILTVVAEKQSYGILISFACGIKSKGLCVDWLCVFGLFVSFAV